MKFYCEALRLWSSGLQRRENLLKPVKLSALKEMKRWISKSEDTNLFDWYSESISLQLQQIFCRSVIKRRTVLEGGARARLKIRAIEDEPVEEDHLTGEMGWRGSPAIQYKRRHDSKLTRTQQSRSCIVKAKILRTLSQRRLRSHLAYNMLHLRRTALSSKDIFKLSVCWICKSTNTRK